MKRLLFCLFLLSCIQAKTQVPNTPLDFSIDSSRKPLFGFRYDPQREISYRWGFYHHKDIKKEKLPFKVSIMRNKSWAPDSVLFEDYRDSIGEYWVCLEATYTNGIKDTICKRINSRVKVIDYAPNVFLPDSTGTKTFDIRMQNELSYHLMIFNRWGMKVFESKDKNYDWNGTVNNEGQACPDGTYYYILKYRLTGKDLDEPAMNGTITVRRDR